MNPDLQVRVGASGNIDFCGLHDLPKISDPRGSLTFIEGNQHIPFGIERV